MKESTRRELNNIWNICNKDPYSFILTADKNGFGLISIKEFLEEKGVYMTEEEIDRVRCPLLYISEE